jgi:predicted permease
MAAFLRGVTGREDDRDVRDEMEAHVALETDENIRRGMSPGEARRKALVAARGLTIAAESVREARGLPWAESLMTDLRYAVRSLGGHPAYTAAVVITLALGIGATTAMFTILNAVVLRPLPFPNAERILSLSVASEGSDRQVADGGSYEEWARAARSLEAVAAYGLGSSVIQTASGPQEVRAIPVTASYFSVFGVNPMLGRVFTEEEHRPDGPGVVLISEQLWRTQFASDPLILGKSLVGSGTPNTIIGVMPASFATPRGAQLWRPYSLPPATEGVTNYYFVVARMRPDASLQTVRSELALLQRRLEPQRTESRREHDPVAMTLHDRRYGSARTTLILLFAAVGVLLLITCANLTNLSLARATRRHREFSLRIALGAHRLRLARHVLIESFVLSLGGAILGLALAASSIGYFVRISPGAVANAEGIAIDGAVLVFTLAVAVITSVLFGLVPAIVAGRTPLTPALAAGTPRGGGSRRQRFLRRSIVVLELATALVLVVGAALVARTFWSVTSINVGFDPEQVVTAQIQLPSRAYTDTTARHFMEELLHRVSGQPGVQAAALADALPLSGTRMSVTHEKEGQPAVRFEVLGVTAGYFETMGTRITEGRGVESGDREGGIQVAVVSAALARALFPGRSAIGERLNSLQGDEATIVGVSEDVRQRQLEGAVSLVAFMPLAQLGGWNYLSLAVRAPGPTARVTRSVTRIVQDMDAALPPPPFRTMNDIVAEEVAPRKFIFVLLALFAGLAGVLAAVGLYGVLAYLVAEQTREIGIRVALGADRQRVMRLMMGQGAALTAVGLTLGIGAGLLCVRLLESMVYEMTVYDGWAFGTAVAALGGVAMLASFIPARRASRVDPVIALRAE